MRDSKELWTKLNNVFTGIGVTILVLYVLVIYGNSFTPASASSLESGWVLHHIQQLWSCLGLPAAQLNDHMVRKAAHFIEYTGLGLLLTAVIKTRLWPAEKKKHIFLLLALAIPFVDETVQLFSKGRAGAISDVWLDMSGIAFGALLAGAALFWHGERQHRIEKGKQR